MEVCTIRGTFLEISTNKDYSFMGITLGRFHIRARGVPRKFPTEQPG